MKRMTEATFKTDRNAEERKRLVGMDDMFAKPELIEPGETNAGDGIRRALSDWHVAQDNQRCTQWHALGSHGITWLVR